MSLCAGPSCDRPAIKKSLCGAHYQQMHSRGEMWVLGSRGGGKPKRWCTFEGCDKPNFAHGLCNSHRRQKIDFGIELRPVRLRKPEAPEGFAYCSACRECLPHSAYDWDPGRGQPKRVCIACRTVRRRAKVAADPFTGRRKRMRDKYGMQPEDFLNLYRKQNGKCAICGVAVPNLLEDLGRANGKIAVDHDHATGAVRGLLCTQCNLAIGYMQDNPDRLESAARYLRERSSSV